MSVWASAGMALARRMEPETAHQLSLSALRLGLAGRDHTPDDPILAVRAFNRVLRNPIGLAAGFDKNAVAVNALGRLGFGFVEAGTVTPRPQTGNPKPRLFRLPEDAAVINRMGFNNAGIDVFVRNLRAASRAEIALGANIGINKENAAPETDYPALAKAVSAHADYVTVNISSPNTPGLRDLQTSKRLTAILAGIRVQKPVFVKIAPDLDDSDLATIVAVCMSKGVEGLIISNTTLARPENLQGRHKQQAGGLSGAPLFAPSCEMLKNVHDMAGGKLTLIGVGGIFSAEDVFSKILAGASLVQLYTGFAYHGPALIPRLKTGLAALLRARGFKSVFEAVGAGP